MTSSAELERWLAGEDVWSEQYPAADHWVAGFDADRQVVLFKLGPFKRIYLRPLKFTKRFYHQLYPLPIADWPYRKQICLFDNFCRIEIDLRLRFQATLAYALRNSELLPSINQHIQETYADLLDDIVNRELLKLADGGWVHTGLGQIETAISASICELLAMQHIQSQAVCAMAAEFDEFPDVQLGRQHVYLNVLKKTFEINEQKNRELSRQNRLLEKQKILEKQLELEHLNELTELELQAQALEAEKQRRLLEDREQQLAEQLIVEKRLYAQRIRHEAELKEIQMESDLQVLENNQARQRLADSRLLDEQLAQQARMENKKMLAEIQRRENAETLLQQADLKNQAPIDSNSL